MTHITFDYEQALSFVTEDDIQMNGIRVEEIHKELHDQSTDELGYKGWVHLPKNYDREEVFRIEQTAKRIKEHSDILLVIGVGGSYLGARAAIEMLHHNFYDLLPKEERKTPHIVFVGHNMSTTYIKHVQDILRTKEFSINVILKSGTTTEPAI